MRRSCAVVFALLVALLIAGCGSDDGSSSKAKQTKSSSETTVLQLKNKGDELRFDTDKLKAKAGKVTIKFTNTSSIPHNVAIKKGKKTLVSGDLIVNGDSNEISADLEPGTYEFVCEPHEAAGMVGELVVS